MKYDLLIVDDDEVNQIIISQLLNPSNFTFTFALNGLEAVQLCQKQNFDLIIMDIHMPVMDGYQASEQIKSKTNVPIIAVSADAEDKQLIKQCFKSGVDKIICKPVDKIVFHTYIKEVLKIPEHKKNVADQIDFNSTSVSLKAIILSSCQKYFTSQDDYLRSIKLFKKQHSDAVQTLQKLLLNKDYDQCIRYVHTLKGLSKHIGSQTVHLLFKDFEQSLKENQYQDLPKQLKPINRLYKQLMSDIELLLENNTLKNHKDKKTIKKSDEAELVMQLEHYLSTFDTRALLVLNKLTHSIKQNEFQVLEDLIEQFKYDKALSFLKDTIK